MFKEGILYGISRRGIEDNETPEQACIRETKEETGFDIKIEGHLCTNTNKHTFRAQIIGGEMNLDNTKEYNSDLIDIAWIELSDDFTFDSYTKPIIELHNKVMDNKINL